MAGAAVRLNGLAGYLLTSIKSQSSTVVVVELVVVVVAELVQFSVQAGGGGCVALGTLTSPARTGAAIKSTLRAIGSVRLIVVYLA